MDAPSLHALWGAHMLLVAIPDAPFSARLRSLAVIALHMVEMSAWCVFS